jgi:flagellar biosynthesis protein FlhA
MAGPAATRGPAAPTAVPAAPPGPAEVEGLLAVDPLQVEVGYGLLPVVDGAEGGGLLERIRLVRRQFALELGFVVPPIRLRDSATLGGNQYLIRLRGTEVARGDVYPDRFLAMNPGTVAEEVEGLEVREPTFGLPARWISRARRDAAVAAGYTVVDASTVIATHLAETIRRHAAALLGRQEVQALVDQLRKTHPAVVEGLVPGLLSLGVVHRVLQRLLGEGVSIRDLPVILEVLADLAPSTKDPVLLAEHARAALADAVCRPYLASDGTLRVLLLGASTESRLGAELAAAEGEEGLPMAVGQALLDAISRAVAQAPPLDAKPVLLCPAALRRHIRRVTERALPHLGVLSYAEVSPHVTVRAIGTVELELAPQAV